MNAGKSINTRNRRAALGLIVIFGMAYLFVAGLNVYTSWLQLSANNRFEKHEETTLTIASNALVWKKPGKEIWVGDKPFDIRSITPGEKGNLVVTGHFDDEEGRVLKFLEKAVGYVKNMAGRQHAAFAFVLMYYTPFQQWQCQPLVQEWLREPTCFTETHVLQGYHNSLHRPPRSIALG